MPRLYGQAVASIEVRVELSDDELAALDDVVSSGAFSSRSEAFQQAVASFLRRRSSAGIAASYRRAYRDSPEDERLAGLGLRLLGDRLREERTEP
jgi:Arc/MetJ-type ribon-helix-helix transcriptional regulator